MPVSSNFNQRSPTHPDIATSGSFCFICPEGTSKKSVSSLANEVFATTENSLKTENQVPQKCSEINAPPSKLSETVHQLMREFSIASKEENVPKDYRIDRDDWKIAASLSFVLDMASKKGNKTLDETIEKIETIAKNYKDNPGESRFQLTELIHQKFLEYLPNTRHSANEKFLSKWKGLLNQRLKLYQSITDQNLPCPIGCFGEEPPTWFKPYRAQTLSAAG